MEVTLSQILKIIERLPSPEKYRADYGLNHPCNALYNEVHEVDFLISPVKTNHIRSIGEENIKFMRIIIRFEPIKRDWTTYF